MNIIQQLEAAIDNLSDCGDADGRAYNSTGIVFEDEDGWQYTNSKSRVYIEFPYTPTVQYVKRNSEFSTMVKERS